MGIFFDVGANNGQDSIKFSDDPNNIVYAFEAGTKDCTPEVVGRVKWRKE